MKRRALLGFLLAALLVAGSPGAQAEANEVRVAQQYGLAYLPLMVMQDQKFYEKELAAAGLPDVKVNWFRFSGSHQMTDAILSNSLDFAAGSIANILILWDRTGGNVKGVVPYGVGPIHLVTRRADFKTLKDIQPSDRIAVPAIKTSFGAMMLQMVAADLYGIQNYQRFDANTVAMPHPEAMALVMSGRGEVDSYFAAPPFQEIMLADPRFHSIITSDVVMGGSHTNGAVFSTEKFRRANPKIFEAFLKAYGSAVKYINDDKPRSMAIYKRLSNDKNDVETIYKQFAASGWFFTTQPSENVTKVSDFLNATGQIKGKPASWRDVFFSGTDNALTR